MFLKCFAVLLVAGFMAGCASPAYQGGPNNNTLPPGAVSVSPDQLISVHFIELRAPASSGWGLIRQARAVHLFRHGTQSNETFAAQVVFFPIKHGDLMSQVRNGIQADSPSDRFETIKAEYVPENKRGYPCIRYEGISSDKKAKTGMWSTAELILQVSALYCRHPQKDNIGFAAIYSHRGKTLYPGFQAEAEQFIENVRVPKN